MDSQTYPDLHTPNEGDDSRTPVFFFRIVSVLWLFRFSVSSFLRCIVADPDPQTRRRS